ncbi:unnamed protein product [Psylliodes chrysocephalus]|uniref:Uncharacterized protein n=1 Tax=Psylliodes chrysocephalus TaxID=3402493 RepID=A0A9P0GFL2_9CUCU|nr:unnamed protein product [Psylliodes chrysocephala]
MTSIFGQICFKLLSKSKPNNACNFSILRSKKNRYKFSQYIILKANKDDYRPILKIMHEHFYKNEPTCVTLGIRPNAIIDETALKNMAEGITLVARCKHDGSIVGAAINETSNPWDPDLKEKLASNIECQKMKHWLFFQAHVQRFPKLWCRYDVQKVFELANMFVKRGLKDNEIMLRLINESRNLARDYGYKVFRINATKNIICKMCEMAKMQLTAEIPYCSYVGKNLAPIFNLSHRNKSLKIYIDVNKKRCRKF